MIENSPIREGVQGLTLDVMIHVPPVLYRPQQGEALFPKAITVTEEGIFDLSGQIVRQTTEALIYCITI